MSSADEQAVPCLQCGFEKSPDEGCPSCGMTGQFGPDRPNPFAGATLYAMIGAIGAVFALTLLVVGLTA